jgi:hypothetical protein
VGTEVRNEWSEWAARKKKVAKKIIILGVFLFLSSLCVPLLMAVINDRAALSNSQNETALYFFAVLFFAAIGVFLVGVFKSKAADIPYDVEPAPSESFERGPVIKSVAMTSLKGLALASAILLLISAVVIYLWVVNHWAFDTIFQLPIIVLLFATACVVPATLDRVLNEPKHTEVEIDPANRRICFTNSLTKSTRAYSFDELDGFVHVKFYVSAGKSLRGVYVISLVKAGRRLENISSDAYRNFSSLKEGLNSLRQQYITDTLPAGFRRRRTWTVGALPNAAPRV